MQGEISIFIIKVTRVFHPGREMDAREEAKLTVRRGNDNAFTEFRMREEADSEEERGEGKEQEKVRIISIFPALTVRGPRCLLTDFTLEPRSSGAECTDKEDREEAKAVGQGAKGCIRINLVQQQDPKVSPSTEEIP
eukprot:1394045-Amorphochlora_amoeboformis.AAC.2